MQNLDECIETCAGITEKIQEAGTELDGALDLITELNHILQTTSSGNAITLYNELVGMLREAHTKSEELTGCMATIRNA